MAITDDIFWTIKEIIIGSSIFLYLEKSTVTLSVKQKRIL